MNTRRHTSIRTDSVAPKVQSPRPKKRWSGGDVSAFRRSEEVEAVLGQTPHWIFRWGISIITAIVVALLISTWFIHWPETMTIRGTIQLNSQTGKCCDMVVRLPAEQVRMLHEGMVARISLDIKGDEWGNYHGIIATLPLQSDSTGFYPVHIRINSMASTDKGQSSLGNISRTPTVLKKLQENDSPVILDATATITVSEQRLLQRII